MAGNNISKQILNNTLLFIIQLFKKNNVENWFVAYGTLLGIIRENSCIDGDDDIDIIVCKNNFDNIKKLLLENGFEFDYGYNIGKSRSIIKLMKMVIFMIYGKMYYGQIVMILRKNYYNINGIIK
jgi:phosphorylcholine metabolism protein LicD